MKMGEQLCCATSAEETSEPDSYVQREEQAGTGTVW